MDPYEKLNEMYVNAFSPSDWADEFIQKLTAKVDEFEEFCFSPTQEEHIDSLFKEYKQGSDSDIDSDLDLN